MAEEEDFADEEENMLDEPDEGDLEHSQEDDVVDHEEPVEDDESDEGDLEHSQEDDVVEDHEEPMEEPGGASPDSEGALGAGLADVLRAGLTRGLEDLGLAEGVAMAWAESLAEGLVWPEGLAWPEGLDSSGRTAMAWAEGVAGLEWSEGLAWPEGLDLTPEELCAGVLKAPQAAARWSERNPLLVLLLVLLVLEILRYAWHCLRLVALNFRRHTPPSIGYSMTKSLEEHAAFVETIFCDRSDHTFLLEGLFLGRTKLEDISREMLEEALLALLSMEVRRWYSSKHHDLASHIIDVLEEKMGVSFHFAGHPVRHRTRSGGSVAQPIQFDAHPEAARQPFMATGERKICAYFKPLPVQLAIWLAKGMKSALLWKWGFRWKDLGPVQMWVRRCGDGCEVDDPDQPPLLFCPGLFLGNTAYLRWIQHGLLPLARRRPLLLLELPHLSHGIDPRRIAYSLRYSWPTTDEICDALANELSKWPAPADIIGNSFGTVIMTALRVDHRYLLRKFVYIDPVCFPPCYPGPQLMAFCPSLDSYWTLLMESFRAGPIRTWLPRLLKFWILRPAIFGDIEVQYVMKRGLYVQEALESGVPGAESLVVIGKQDELLNDPVGIAAWVERHYPEATIRLVDFNHGVLMGRPGPYARLARDFLEDAG